MVMKTNIMTEILYLIYCHFIFFPCFSFIFGFLFIQPGYNINNNYFNVNNFYSFYTFFFHLLSLHTWNNYWWHINCHTKQSLLMMMTHVFIQCSSYLLYFFFIYSLFFHVFLISFPCFLIFFHVFLILSMFSLFYSMFSIFFHVFLVFWFSICLTKLHY